MKLQRFDKRAARAEIESSRDDSIAPADCEVAMSLVRVALFAVVACLSFPLAASAAPERSTGLDIEASENLRGVWCIVSMEQSGVGAPFVELQQIQIVIDGNSMSIEFSEPGNAASTVVDEMKIVLDTSTYPKRIDFVSRGIGAKSTFKGIYKITGDTLVLCGDDEADRRPETFSLEGISSRSLMVLKRVSRVIPPKK